MFALSSFVPYPASLLPQPNYCLLTPIQVLPGWLLRRVNEAAVFLPERAKINGRPLLRADLLGSPAQRLPEGFSVNLLGQFTIADAAWEPTPGAAKLKMRELWRPGQLTVPPTPAEMQLLLTGWDAYALNVAELHTYELTTARGKFVAHVCHAPNCWNYWHYEVRFEHETQGWAHLPGAYSDPQLRKVGAALRQALQESGLAQPVAAAGTPAPWPATLFDSA